MTTRFTPAQADEAVTATLNNMIAAGAKAREAFITAATNDSIRHLWSQAGNLVDIAIAEQAAEIAEKIEDNDTHEVLANYVAKLTESLLEGWDEGRSTSSLSNAMDECTRNAKRSLLKTLAGLVRLYA